MTVIEQLDDEEGEMGQQPEMLLGKGSHGGNSVWVSTTDAPLPRSEADLREELAQAQRDAAEQMQKATLEKEGATPEIPRALKAVDAEKLKGNTAFKEGQQELAVQHYTKALDMLLKPPLAATATGNKAAVTLRCNLAASYLKSGKFTEAVQECSKALLMDKSHVKALFRRAEAYRELQMYSKAVQDLDCARRLEPRNQAVHFAYEDAEDLLEEEGDGPGPAARPGTAVASSDDAARMRAAAERFADQCVEMLREDFAKTAQLPAKVMLYHGDPTLPVDAPGADRRGMGTLVIDGAFQSASMLREALEFVHSQHTTLDATVACVVVRKSTMLYPLVWWAGTWPYDINQDGVFLELSVASAKHLGTWFMPFSKSGTTLLPAQKLDDDCALLVDMPSVFPALS